jgi:hypothetical protein
VTRILDLENGSGALDRRKMLAAFEIEAPIDNRVRNARERG